jgi:hypothetical protein
MAITETLRGLGSWSLQLKPNIPDELWKDINYYGHIVIHTGKSPDPRIAGDSLLKSSRYTGVLRSISERPDMRAIGGLGMAMWLGDPDNKGDIVETLLNVSGTFQAVINAVLAGYAAVTPGTIYNVAENYTGSFQFQSCREIIDYICQTVGAAWRVNGDATLDAGLESDLFVTDPKMIVVRKRNSSRTVASADDMFLRALSGSLETGRDVEDFTTRVLLMAQGSNGQFASATADIAPGLNPFLDLHGNPIKMTRIVQESETDPTNAEARAQLQLNRFSGTRDALTLSTVNYDIKGDAEVGDYIGVFDPAMGLVDATNEEIFRSERINPIHLKLTEISWPITRGMSAFYRSYLGAWHDLTEYVVYENGDTTLVVGGYNRALTEGGTGAFPVTPPEVDTTIPGPGEWDPPFLQSMYQSPITGESRSEVELKWFRPNNTDLTPMTDLSYYEIRYRTATTPLFPVTIQDVAPYELDELATVGEPIQYAATEWQYARAPENVLKFRLQELTPGMAYEAQIRAVDSARPANLGAWSDVIEFQMSRDILPPATPAPPVIAANPMAVQMKHFLGRSDGGEFNLDRDLHHLELHGGTEPLFQPTNETLLGKTLANWGMITGQIPIVGSYQITSISPVYFKVVAVDESGNKSLPSSSVKVTAELISDQYVENLTVTKITAGTISADWIIGSYIRTGTQGARVEMSYAGIDGYDALGVKRLNWDADSGQLRVIGKGGIAVTGGGNVEITDGALIVYNAAGIKIVELGECADGRHGLQVYKDNGIRVARVGELESSVDEGIEFRSDVGTLVRASTLAFGVASAEVDTFESTTSSTYVNLATVGPFVTVEIGNSGRALVFVTCWTNISDAGLIAMSYDVAGPGGYFIAAVTQRALYHTSSFGDPTKQIRATAMSLMTGLPAGNCTFQAKYRANSQGGGCSQRQIMVYPY